MSPNFGGIRPRKPIDGCGMAPLPAEDGKTSSCDPAISCDSAILAYDEAEERDRIVECCAAGGRRHGWRDAGHRAAFVIPMEAGTNCRFGSKVL